MREVFARVRNGDPAVADLYAEDAVVVYGAGARVEGRAAIRDFYEQTIAAMHPQPQVEAVLEAPPFYAVVVDVPFADGHHRALDVFEVDGGGIRSLHIFAQG